MLPLPTNDRAFAPTAGRYRMIGKSGSLPGEGREGEANPLQTH